LAFVTFIDLAAFLSAGPADHDGISGKRPRNQNKKHSLVALRGSSRRFVAPCRRSGKELGTSGLAAGLECSALILKTHPKNRWGERSRTEREGVLRKASVRLSPATNENSADVGDEACGAIWTEEMRRGDLETRLPCCISPDGKRPQLL
jgi:hypothetical protein